MPRELDEKGKLLTASKELLRYFDPEGIQEAFSKSSWGSDAHVAVFVQIATDVDVSPSERMAAAKHLRTLAKEALLLINAFPEPEEEAKRPILPDSQAFRGCRLPTSPNETSKLLEEGIAQSGAPNQQFAGESQEQAQQEENSDG